MRLLRDQSRRSGRHGCITESALNTILDGQPSLGPHLLRFLSHTLNSLPHVGHLTRQLLSLISELASLRNHLALSRNSFPRLINLALRAAYLVFQASYLSIHLREEGFLASICVVLVHGLSRLLLLLLLALHLGLLALQVAHSQQIVVQFFELSVLHGFLFDASLVPCAHHATKGLLEVEEVLWQRLGLPEDLDRAQRVAALAFRE